MKSVVRVLTVGLFAVLMSVAFAATASAQTCDQPTKEALYKTYIDNYAGSTIAQRQKAVDAGNEYVRLCGSSKIDVDIVNYLKGAIPELNKWIAAERVRLEKIRLYDEEQARFNRFNKAYKATNKNWDEIFAAASDVLRHEPAKFDIRLDLRILLASAGTVLAESGPGAAKYNRITHRYAQDALRRIKAGEKSTSGKWGAFDYAWGTKDNALGWLNYAVAYIEYYPLKQKDKAIPYFYKATQLNSDTKKFAPIYETLGSWYSAKAVELEQKRKGIIITEEAGEDLEANIQKALEILGFQKGYVERAIDAYARAYSLAKANKDSTAKYKGFLFDRLKQLFQFRYPTEDEAELRSEEKINDYVAGISQNALPNPLTKVQPVIEQQEEVTDEKPANSTEGSNTQKKPVAGQRSRTVNTTAVKKVDN